MCTWKSMNGLIKNKVVVELYGKEPVRMTLSGISPSNPQLNFSHAPTCFLNFLIGSASISVA